MNLKFSSKEEITNIYNTSHSFDFQKYEINQMSKPSNHTYSSTTVTSN